MDEESCLPLSYLILHPAALSVLKPTPISPPPPPLGLCNMQEAMRHVHEKWSKELDETASHKFRSWNDHLMPYMHHYYVIEEGSKCCNNFFDVRNLAGV